MFSIAELKRKLKNIVYIASIVSTKSSEGKSLATVRVGEDEESDFFPLLSFSSTFKKHWIPIRKDEQVIVLHPFGNANKGYLIRGIFFKDSKEPIGANDTTEVMEFEDGARFSYDVSTGTLLVVGIKKVVVKAEKIVLDGEVETTKSLAVAKNVQLGANVIAGGTIADIKGDLSNFKTTDGAGRS